MKTKVFILKQFLPLLMLIASFLAFTVATQPVVVAANPVSQFAGLVDGTQCQGGSTECVQGCSDPALNQADACGGQNTCQKGQDCSVFKRYLNPLIQLLVSLVGIAVTIGIIMGGIQYATSAGDAQKAAAAKLRIRNAILALIGFFFLYAFIKFLTPGSTIFSN